MSSFKIYLAGLQYSLERIKKKSLNKESGNVKFFRVFFLEQMFDKTDTTNKNAALCISIRTKLKTISSYRGSRLM